MTQGTSKNYIGLRPKVCNNILGDLYSKTKNPNSDFNNILSIDRQTNKKTELDARAIFMTLY